MTADKPSPLVPMLRFPEFCEDTPWLSPQLADLYEFKRTNTLARDNLNYESGTIRNVHYGDIHTKFKPLFRLEDEHVPYINPDAAPNGFDDDAFCEEGDIILADASEDLGDVGKAIEVVSLAEERVVAGTHTILATRRGSVPVVGFGGHLFQSAAVRAGIKKEAQGSKVYGISANRISAVPVPVPPTMAEQQKIADCLGSLDNVIAAEGRKLETLRQHKQGLMQQLFPLPGETVPRLRFPEFADGPEWREWLFDDLLDSIIDYRGRTPKKLGMQWGNGDIVSLSANNVKNGYIDLDAECHMGSEALYERWMGEESLELGDLVLTMEAPLGKALLIPDSSRYILSQRVVALKTNDRIENPFLLQLMWSPSFKSDLFRRATGSTAQGISQKALRSLPVRVPKAHEQLNIAGALVTIDEYIFAQQRWVDVLLAHKAGLLQQLFPNTEAG